MRKFVARDLLKYTEDELWALSDPAIQGGGDILLTMDDGEIDVSVNSTILSWYLWWPQKYLPETPLLCSHHVQDEQLTNKIPCVYMARSVWAMHDIYSQSSKGIEEFMKVPLLYDMGYIVIEDMHEKMALHIRQHMCNLHNVMISRLGEYVVSLDALDILEVLDDERIREINEEIQSIDLENPENLKGLAKRVAAENDNVMVALLTQVKLKYSRLAQLVRTGGADRRQILQLISLRGFITELNSVVFPIPTLRAFAHGFHDLYDMAIESRASAMSLMLNKSKLADTEYFQRQLQLVCQVISTLDKWYDCKTERTLDWAVTAENLPQLEGMWARRKKGQEYFSITSDMTELVGTIVELRTALGCEHPDPGTVCGKCYSESCWSVPTDSNIGHFAAALLCSIISQLVLSNKHFTGSASIDEIKYKGETAQYLRGMSNQYQVVLIKPRGNAKASIAVDIEDVSHIKDVMDADDLDSITPSLISEMTNVYLETVDDGEVDITPLQVSTNSRKAYFSTEMLDYIKQNGYVIDEKRYVIDLEEWDYTNPMWELPRKQGGMVEFMNTVQQHVKGTGKEEKAKVNTQEDINESLRSFFELVNSKFNFPLFLLAVISKATLIRSAVDKDYRLPRKGEVGQFGKYSEIMKMRSLDATMALEEHGKVITSRDSFQVTNREPHVMGEILVPTNKPL